MDIGFYNALYSWYEVQGRRLPWRETMDPYRIWISEVILQQTRVGQGTHYYNSFISRFPNVSALANSSEQDVLHIWQGLGYYSRARNLYKSALIIHDRYGDIFPIEYEDILSLPGVGKYTASAIMCFAFDAPRFAIDGNAIRVISRLYNTNFPIHSKDSANQFDKIASFLLDRRHPRLFNSAFMELGELVCVPTFPKCEKCPITSFCLARQKGTEQQLPLKKMKQTLPARYLHYLVYLDSNLNTLLKKRMRDDIWKHLYEFPLKEPSENIESNTETFTLHHTLTHQYIIATFYIIKTDTLPQIADAIQINLHKSHTYPLHQLMRKAMKIIQEQVVALEK